MPNDTFFMGPMTLYTIIIQENTREYNGGVVQDTTKPLDAAKILTILFSIAFFIIKYVNYQLNSSHIW
jgi:hypothetical protein